MRSTSPTITFNGAMTSQPWIPEQAGDEGHRHRRFNGAMTFQPWIPKNHLRKPHAADPFNGAMASQSWKLGLLTSRKPKEHWMYLLARKQCVYTGQICLSLGSKTILLTPHPSASKVNKAIASHADLFSSDSASIHPKDSLDHDTKVVTANRAYSFSNKS